MKKSQEISIGLEKLGDDRFCKESQNNLVSSIYENASKSSHLIFCDSAEIYGLNNSEKLLGQLAQKIGRKRFHISSKVGLTYKYEGSKLITYRYFDEDSIKSALENSCKRLNSAPNRIYLHWPHPTDAEITINCLKTLVLFAEKLHIKEVGICNVALGQPKITLAILKDLGISVVQERINLLCRKNKFLSNAKNLDFKVVSHSTFAQGILTNSSKEILAEGSQYEFPKFLNESKYEYEYAYEWIDKVNWLMKEISSQLGMNPYEIVVACQKILLGENSEMIIGVRNKMHIDPIFNELRKVKIDNSVYQKITDKLQEFQYEARSPNH